MPYGITKLKRSIRGWIKPVFWALVVIFLIGGAYSFSGPGGRGGGARRQQAGPKQRLSPFVARVNGQEVSRAAYEGTWRQYAQRRDITFARVAKAGAYDELVQMALLQQAAQREKIRVSRQEVDAKRRELVDQQLAPDIAERTALQQQLDKRGITLGQLVQERMQEYPEDAVRRMLQEEKLRDRITNAVSVTDQDLVRSFEEMRVAQIICRAPDMKRKALAAVDAELAKLPSAAAGAKAGAPSGGGPQDQRRVELEAQKAALEQKDWEAEAKKKAEDLLAQLKGGADFGQLARKESDEPTAALGEYTSQWMNLQNAGYFRDVIEAALPLKQAELAGPVKTPIGWHLIRKEASRSALPKDFEQKKQQYRDQFVEQQKSAAWEKYQRELRDTATIQIADPEIKAYEDQLKIGPEAPQLVPLLNEAIAQNPLNVAAMWELATVWKEKQQPAEAIKLLQQALKAMKENPDYTDASVTAGRVHLELGLMLKAQGKKDEALAQLKDAADGILAARGGYDEQMQHEQLRDAFKELGRQDLAAAEQKWLDDYKKQQEQAGAGGQGPLVMPQ